MLISLKVLQDMDLCIHPWDLVMNGDQICSPQHQISRKYIHQWYLPCPINQKFYIVQ